MKDKNSNLHFIQCEIAQKEILTDAHKEWQNNNTILQMNYLLQLQLHLKSPRILEIVGKLNVPKFEFWPIKMILNSDTYEHVSYYVVCMSDMDPCLDDMTIYSLKMKCVFHNSKLIPNGL